MHIGTLEAFTNREDWEQAFTLVDETDTLIDVDEITMALRDSNNNSPLSGTLSGGPITRLSAGTYQWSYPEASTHPLCPGTYKVGIRIELSGAKSQLFAGTVAVLNGVVD